MRFPARLLQWTWLFVCFILLIVLFDAISARIPLRAVRAYTADVATKKQVDRVKQMVDECLAPHELTKLVSRNGEIATTEIGRFPFDNTPITDSWGVPILILGVDSRDDADLSVAGVYSKGPDGVSLTRGNDADDISSWASLDNHYWEKVHRDSFRERWIVRFELAAGLAILSCVAASVYQGWRQWRAVESKQNSTAEE